MLIILALAKLFLTVTCLSLGWTGGYVFPSFFIGASAGLAMHLIFPFIPEVVCMVCVISGIAVALLRSPLAISMIIATMFQFDLTPVIAIAIVSSFILTLGASMLIVEKEKDISSSTRI
jgi:H+/Cl- antiporter ClcA